MEKHLNFVDLLNLVVFTESRSEARISYVFQTSRISYSEKKKKKEKKKEKKVSGVGRRA